MPSPLLETPTGTFAPTKGRTCHDTFHVLSPVRSGTLTNVSVATARTKHIVNVGGHSRDPSSLRGREECEDMRTTIIRRLGISGVAMALAVGGAAAAQPAEAATSNCASGYACLWRDNDYRTNGSGSGWMSFQYSVSNLSGWYYNGFSHTGTYSADNSATSIYNSGNELRACFYQDAVSGGKWQSGPFCLPLKAGRNNLATSVAPAGWNDRISAARFVN